MRKEKDVLGSVEIPGDALYGIHTARALENFPLSGLRLRPAFIHALGQVKLAAAMTNAQLGYLADPLAGALLEACREMAEGLLDDHIVVDAFQGGAGTSTNMNVSEVLANRACILLGGRPGDHHLAHPMAHANLHQSTNDVFPTALRVAALTLLKELEAAVAGLQEALQAKEAEFADVVKVGRTELMDAVPMTLGMEFGALAEAVARDRWRIFKCRERIKQVNLGGTAVGTGLGAPREYVFKAWRNLKQITGLSLSLAENLVDATQNLDSLVEAMGMLNAHAANLLKLCGDLRLLASGPACGLGEIELPALQAGSSIMPGKINPVMAEAASQTAIRVMAANQAVTMAAALGQLDLNQLMPLLAHELLEALHLLIQTDKALAEKCVRGIKARPERCRELVEKSPALATVLVPVLGYERVGELMRRAEESGKSLARVLAEAGIADEKTSAALLSPGRMRKLGFSDGDYAGLGEDE